MATSESAVDEQVVLLTPDGQPCGTARKDEVHTATTPYHLAFSCYVFDRSGRLLLTRRADTKQTWPGVWTNSCCGHPTPGEEVADAVRRRLQQELRLEPTRLELALPEFSYRASLHGVVEHELCPVYLALVENDPVPDPAEVGEWVWVEWGDYVARAAADDSDVSPWSRLQVPLLREQVASFLSERPET